MPELPEVETSRRGITPHIKQQSIDKVIVRQGKLRWPVPANLAALLSHQTVTRVRRRGKYLLLDLNHGSLIIHLGMSGSLRIVEFETEAAKHDHIDICFANNKVLRYNDPRRFGSILWTDHRSFATSFIGFIRT